MEWKVFEDFESMSKLTADEIVEDLHRNPRQLLCIAAGHTSVGVMEELAKRYERGEIDFSQAAFVAMDEWVGMNEKTDGSCGWLLDQCLIRKVNYPEGNVFLWNGEAESLEAECERAVKFIRDHSDDNAIDYLVLGTGMNGHLALNEPGTSLDARAHVVKLSETSAKVGQKYFSKPTVLQGGVTLGLADFGEAKRTVLLVSEAKKGEVLKKITAANGFDPQVPATAMYQYTNASIYCDRDAWDASGHK